MVLATVRCLDNDRETTLEVVDMTVALVKNVGQVVNLRCKVVVDRRDFFRGKASRMVNSGVDALGGGGGVGIVGIRR